MFLDRSPYSFRADHIFALLDRLGITQPVHVIGNSFGGSVAIRMLETHSPRLASVASINGTGGARVSLILTLNWMGAWKRRWPMVIIGR